MQFCLQRIVVRQSLQPLVNGQVALFPYYHRHSRNSKNHQLKELKDLHGVQG